MPTFIFKKIPQGSQTSVLLHHSTTVKVGRKLKLRTRHFHWGSIRDQSRMMSVLQRISWDPVEVGEMWFAAGEVLNISDSYNAT